MTDLEQSIEAEAATAGKQHARKAFDLGAATYQLGVELGAAVFGNGVLKGAEMMGEAKDPQELLATLREALKS